MKSKLLLLFLITIVNSVSSQTDLMNSFNGPPDLTNRLDFYGDPNYLYAVANNVTATAFDNKLSPRRTASNGTIQNLWKAVSSIQMNVPLTYFHYSQFNVPQSTYTTIGDPIQQGYHYIFKMPNNGNVDKRGILMEFNKRPSDIIADNPSNYVYNINPNTAYRHTIKINEPLAIGQYFYVAYRHQTDPLGQYQWLPITFPSPTSLFTTFSIPGLSTLGEVEFFILSKSKAIEFSGDTEYQDSIYNLYTPGYFFNPGVENYNIIQSPIVNNTIFTVNMTGQTIAEDGVFLQMNGSVHIPMNSIGNNLYTVSIPLNNNQEYYYRYVNGKFGEENVPLACRDPNQTNPSNFRYFLKNTENTTLPTYCFSSCNSTCSPMIDVTFRVDTTGQVVGSLGVNLAGSFNGFSTSATPMTNIGNNVYQATVNLIVGSTVQYKFVNGTNFETVPNQCSTNDGSGNFNRTLLVPNTNTTLGTVCFNFCTSTCSTSNTCIPPSTLGFTNITSNSALLTWTASNPVPSNGYDVFYNTTGIAPTATTTPSDTSPNPFEGINNLIPNTVYYYWVRSNCGSSQSQWIQGASTFTTHAFFNCNSADYGLFPTATFTPSCTGSAEVIVSNAWASEYSNVNVMANKQYTFSSSVSSDYITITNQAGTQVLLSGQTPLIWFSDAYSGVIRYFIHTNSSCGNAEVNRVKRILCSNNSPTMGAVVFNVNMSNQAVSSLGVKVAGSFNNWSTTANNLGTTGNGIYGTFVMIPLGSVIQYKYVNGNNFENVPTSCTVNDGNGNFNRSYYVNLSGVNTLPLVCFNECTNCSTLNAIEFNKQSLRVFPNPVKSGQEITIELLEDQNIKLFDMTGKLIDEKLITVDDPKYKLLSISAGVYFLKSDKGTTKLIVQ
jgi:hypothetical protein